MGITVVMVKRSINPPPLTVSTTGESRVYRTVMRNSSVQFLQKQLQVLSSLTFSLLIFRGGSCSIQLHDCTISPTVIDYLLRFCLLRPIQTCSNMYLIMSPCFSEHYKQPHFRNFTQRFHACPCPCLCYLPLLLSLTEKVSPCGMKT